MSDTTVTANGDAIAVLAEMARRAAEPIVIGRDQAEMHSEHTMFHLDRHTGDLRTHRMPAPTRSHVFHQIGSFVEFVNNAHDGKHSSGMAERCGRMIILCGDSEATCFLDDEDRRDAVRLRFETTPVFDFLESHDCVAPRRQGDFVKLLRTTFAGALPSDLLGAVRRLEWTSGSSGHAELRQGKESLGKSIDAEVRGMSALPGSLTLRVQVFTLEDPLPDCPIECAMLLDVQDQTFAIHPLPMETADARSAAIAEVMRQLRADIEPDVPIYRADA